MTEPICKTCDLRKPPIGRSVAPAMANGMCSMECPGYRDEPKPGNHWPNEDCSPAAVEKLSGAVETRCLFCWKLMMDGRGA